MEDRYFKAKRVDNGEWVIGNLITNVFFRLGQSIPYILCPDKAEYDCFEDFTEENGIFEVRPSTICQCTGLKDKNGNLIWENDITNCIEAECYGEIVWNESEAGFYFNVLLEDGTYEEEHIYDYVDCMDVIGNIFDNPELLESEEFETDGELEENCDLALLTRHFKEDNISTEFDRPLPQKGEKYKHFKLGKIVTVIGISRHTETEELAVVYEYEGTIWSRPLEMFMSEVDKEKYPNTTQKYRFEKVESEEK